jgi:TonB family protein
LAASPVTASPAPSEAVESMFLAEAEAPRNIGRFVAWAFPIVIVAVVGAGLWIGRGAQPGQESTSAKAAATAEPKMEPKTEPKPEQAVPQPSEPAQVVANPSPATSRSETPAKAAAIRESSNPVVPAARKTPVERTGAGEAEFDTVRWTLAEVRRPAPPLEAVEPAPLPVAGGQLPVMPVVVTSTPTLTKPEAPAAGDAVSGGKLLVRVEPVYPEVARQLNKQGVVMVVAVVNREGRLEKLRVVSGDRSLAGAALAAAAQWRYEPFRVGGKAVEKEISIAFRFQL